MSFLGSGFVGNDDASFYQPEPTGVNASRWSRFPAIQEVDMNGNDILNINNLTINGEVDLENLVLTDLTVENDVSVGRDLTAIQGEIVGFTGITFGTSAFGANPRINTNGQGSG